MENNRKIELLEKSLERLLEWIRSADSKIAPVLAIDTSMLAVLVVLVTSGGNRSSFGLVVFAAAALGLLISLIFLLLAVFPRISGPGKSLIYFQDILGVSSDIYKEKLLNLTEGQYVDDLCKQCHRIAVIAGSKYKRVRLAMIFQFVSLVPWLLAVFMLYRG